MLHGKLGEVESKSRVYCGVQVPVTAAREVIHATVWVDTGVEGRANGGGPEVMAGMRR